MQKYLKQFIQDNLELIQANTLDSWKEIYKQIINVGRRGEFTQVMLEAGIDPSHIMKDVPPYYLSKSDLKSYEVIEGIKYIEKSAF